MIMIKLAEELSGYDLPKLKYAVRDTIPERKMKAVGNHWISLQNLKAAVGLAHEDSINVAAF